MSKQETISIVVPTFRPESPTIKAFFNLTVPQGFQVEYIFVIDNPKGNISKLSALIQQQVDKRIKIIKNNHNLGASRSRNIGIENSGGNYIFFLDDDCKPDRDILEKYANAIRQHPNAPGFIGYTTSPDPVTSFQHAVQLSDMQHFWKIAKQKTDFWWGITANLFVRREAIGSVRFSDKYPK
ncbi:MAG: glycosyltransferase family 2 protein, partial [Candidatus Helarchaeales archaeon]